MEHVGPRAGTRCVKKSPPSACLKLRMLFRLPVFAACRSLVGRSRLATAGLIVVCGMHMLLRYIQIEGSLGEKASLFISFKARDVYSTMLKVALAAFSITGATFTVFAPASQVNPQVSFQV